VSSDTFAKNDANVMPTRLSLVFVELFVADAAKCGSLPAIESEASAEFAACL
jgi:hypothetical protein